jgi:hypothetical protein
VSAQKCTNLDFSILCIHMLNNSYLVLIYMYEGPLKIKNHLYLYGRVTRLYVLSIEYWMKTRMNNFLISLSHSCMYGRGNIRVLEEVVELRTMPLIAYDCKRIDQHFFVVDLGGCRRLLIPLLDHGRH